MFERAEDWLKLAGGAAGLATLAIAVWGMLQALRHPAGRETGAARRVLQRPLLLAATLLFLGGGILLWRPLPLQLSPTLRLVALALGSLLYFPGLALYLWGLKTLGRMFGASSGFGVRLQTGHRLVTHGPYAFVRHPMYLAVILAALGGLLLYRTWTTACFAVMMTGLTIRARREEQALDLEFGQAWQAYACRVPPWLPRPAVLGLPFALGAGCLLAWIAARSPIPPIPPQTLVVVKSPDAERETLPEVFPQAEGGQTFVTMRSDCWVTEYYWGMCAHSGELGLRMGYSLAGGCEGSWGVRWKGATPPRFDASGFTALTFWTKQTAGVELSRVSLRDTSGREASLELDDALEPGVSTWTGIFMPLSYFTANGVDLAALEAVTFGFRSSRDAGSVCLDDIAFEGGRR